MNQISFKNVIPDVFSDVGDFKSDIWDTDVLFEKGNSYLIEAVSGKGKSTFCSYLYGYRNDYKGEIFFDKQNLRSLTSPFWDSARVEKLSLLFQELNLFPELTALENVFLKNNLTHYKSIVQINEMFDLLGIEAHKNQKTGKMSWGQQQRVAIIRCLCQPFHFLLLDEPISHLDDVNAVAVANLIQREATQQGAGIIVTSIGKHLPLDYTKILSL